jgi:hypothetical protein
VNTTVTVVTTVTMTVMAMMIAVIVIMMTIGEKVTARDVGMATVMAMMTNK